MNKDFSDQKTLSGKTVWWWIAFVAVLLSLTCFLWWGGLIVYHLATFHPTGQIVFSCWGERCQVNADGSGRRKITKTSIPVPKGISAVSPVWSPDQKHLAFIKLDDKANIIGLFVVDQDGKNETLLVKDKLIFEPAWSPDSTKIAFTAYSSPGVENTRIYVVNVDGSNRRQLTNTWSSSPAWSPDGTKIVYYCGELCIMNPDGSAQTQLTHMDTYFRYGANAPSWSPDGQYIVYWAQNPFCFLCLSTGQLWVVHADGSDPTRITDGPVDQNPIWQPAP